MTVVLPSRARALPAIASLLCALALAAACSSSGSAAPPVGAVDAGPVDGALGPFVCGLPVAESCNASAPCSFTAWGCVEAACDGYLVITDGAWNYYYSSPGGELAGEVLAMDAGLVSCPYGFQVPAACSPVVASECPDGGGGLDAGSDASDGASGDASDDAGSDGGAADAGADADAS